MSKWHGPAVGEEATDPRVAPKSIVIVCIYMLFGSYVLVEALSF